MPTGAANAIDEAAGEELASVVDGVAVDIEAGAGEGVTTLFDVGLVWEIGNGFVGVATAIGPSVGCGLATGGGVGATGAGTT